MEEKSSIISIKHWSDDDKPREKLLKKGLSILSDAELLAILIGSGNSEESAVDLARRILGKADHSLKKLGRFTVKQLMEFKGIGEAKAIAITAAVEIGRRRNGELPPKNLRITDSEKAAQLLRPLIGELPHEEFWILYLNNANAVIYKALLSKGGITGTSVDARLLLKKALEVGAVGLILAHNHPSGTLKPSSADKGLTTKLQKAAALIDIKVIDHIIITQSAYFSFADHNML